MKLSLRDVGGSGVFFNALYDDTILNSEVRDKHEFCIF